MSRKALCIGCNYPGQRAQLNGCVNDCADNVQLAVSKLGVPANQISVLADAPVPGVRGASPPTRANIISSIKSLVAGAQAGDMIYFSYSGHGTQVKDVRGDEADGMDEAIVPTDYAKTGKVITDDELAAYLVEPLPEGVLLTAVFDCCHAGTILDLDSCVDASSGRAQKTGKKKYVKSLLDLFNFGGDAGLAKAIPPIMDYVHDPIDAPLFKERGGVGPAVFCLSGCRDDQTSLDCTLGGKSCGALTNAFLKAVDSNINADYATVFRAVNDNMSQLRRQISALTQCPQLSYQDAASPSSVRFCQSRGGGGHGGQPAFPAPVNPGHSPPPKKDKKEKKGGKEKKEKKSGKQDGKAKKDKKAKKGKRRDIDGMEVDGDSDDDSSSSDSQTDIQRVSDAGRHILAAAMGVLK